MIRILIVDDSTVVTMFLKAIFEEQPDMEVVGCASDGKQAVRMVNELQPDVVTMDIQMPLMDGLEATREIMRTRPVPIIVVSSAVADKEAEISFKAIEEGAIWVIEKPPAINHPNFDVIRSELVSTIRSMAGMKLITRKNSIKAKNSDNLSTDKTVTNVRINSTGREYEVIVVGCSTGGPQALNEIISHLPETFPIPIVVVQHISTGFTCGMVNWLQLDSKLRLKIVEDDEVLEAGVVYFAPDDHHVLIKRDNAKLTGYLNKSPPINRFRPAATPLLESVAQSCPNSALGMLLTGMGSDGAEGLLAMRKAGCHTIVQDEASSVVFGMPGAAIQIEAVDRIVRLSDMAQYLNTAVANCARK